MATQLNNKMCKMLDRLVEPDLPQHMVTGSDPLLRGMGSTNFVSDGINFQPLRSVGVVQGNASLSPLPLLGADLLRVLSCPRHTNRDEPQKSMSLKHLKYRSVAPPHLLFLLKIFPRTMLFLSLKLNIL